MVYCYIKMGESTKVNGKTIKEQDKALRFISTVIDILVSLETTSLMDLEHTLGPTEKLTKVSGYKAVRMASESGKD